jgi:hypothetical protein
MINGFGVIGAARLGRAAAEFSKMAAKNVRGRAGRIVKGGPRMAKELRAAGNPRQNQPGTFAYPRGRNV